MGYYRDKDKVCRIDNSTKDIVLRIFNLYLQGKSYWQIAQIFNKEKVLYPEKKKWTDTMILRIINDRIYIGDFERYKYREDLIEDSLIKYILDLVEYDYNVRKYFYPLISENKTDESKSILEEINKFKTQKDRLIKAYKEGIIEMEDIKEDIKLIDDKLAILVILIKIFIIKRQKNGMNYQEKLKINIYNRRILRWKK